MAINIDFGPVKDRATSFAQAGAAKAKKLAAIAKLKTDTLAQQDALRKAYTAIGKAYYEAHEGEPDEAFAAAFAKADAAKAAIAANKAALDELKASDPVIVDMEMEAGEMPEDVEEVPGDETPAEDVTEADFAEDAPAADAPAEEVAEEAPGEDTPAE